MLESMFLRKDINENDALNKNIITGETRVEEWNDWIEHLHEEAKITGDEKKIYTLSNNIADIREQIKGFTKPKTKTAGRRIRRWIAKEYMKKPGVEGFELLPSLTQVISARGEKNIILCFRVYWKG